MSYRGASSPWAGILRALEASFRVGVFFGVELRVYWIAVVVMPLFAWSMLRGWPAGDRFIASLVVTLSLYAVIYSHEMGHIAGGWRYGVGSRLITLSPLGGIAHMSTGAPTPRADIWISLAGPVTHLAWLAVFWPLSLWTGAPFWLGFTIGFLVDVNLALMVFNLLPFFPMDGGRVLRAALSMKMASGRATLIACRVGIVGGAILIVYGLGAGPAYRTILMLIGISNILACVQEMRMARHADAYGGAPRLEPWQTDPDAWQRGAAGRAAPASGPGPLARWRQRRATAKRERESAEQADLSREVDRILERLHEVGMNGLSDAERRTLQRASKHKR